MTATPQNGTIEFTDVRTKQKYSLSIYISDVSGGSVTFNPNGAATSTSPDYWTVPGNVVVSDISIVTGLADTTVMYPQSNGFNIPGAIVQDANVVNTIQNRSVPLIPIAAGHQFKLIQG